MSDLVGKIAEAIKRGMWLRSPHGYIFTPRKIDELWDADKWLTDWTLVHPHDVFESAIRDAQQAPEWVEVIRKRIRDMQP